MHNKKMLFAFFMIGLLMLNGCLNKNENTEGAKIEYVTHDNNCLYNNADDMTLYVKNMANHAIYNVTIKCIAYYVNGENMTSYIEKNGYILNNNYKIFYMPPHNETKIEMIVKFYREKLSEKAPKYILKNALVKAEFKICWEYNHKKYCRIQSFEYKFENE